jgi:hypothetical protein
LEKTPPWCKRDSGFCVTVAMMYAHMRILLPAVDAAKVARQLFDLVKITGGEIVLKYVSWMETLCPTEEDCEAFLQNFFESDPTR